MVANPLFEFFLWIFQTVKNISTETVLDFFLHAPQYYDTWWRNLLKESPQHILIETGLILFIIWLTFIRRTVDPGKISKNEKLSKKEIDWLLETWHPEPLVPALSKTEETINSNMMVSHVICLWFF